MFHDHDHHRRHYGYSRLLLLPTLLTLLSRGYDTVSGSLALMAAGTMGIAVLGVKGSCQYGHTPVVIRFMLVSSNVLLEPIILAMLMGAASVFSTSCNYAKLCLLLSRLGSASYEVCLSIRLYL